LNPRPLSLVKMLDSLQGVQTVNILTNVKSGNRLHLLAE
jgi:hypothetical protein